MSRGTPPLGDGRSPEALRWLALGLGAIAAHQIQSLAVEPAERRFRIAALVGPVVAGALIGHLVPVVRRRRVPPATETAPLNLAGGALLVAVGLALLLANRTR